MLKQTHTHQRFVSSWKTAENRLLCFGAEQPSEQPRPRDRDGERDYKNPESFLGRGKAEGDRRMRYDRSRAQMRQWEWDGDKWNELDAAYDNRAALAARGEVPGQQKQRTTN